MNPEDVRHGWAERSGEFSPRYYAHYGPNGTSEQLRGVLDATVGPDAAVLELGCSAGRHLAHLHDEGYEDLHGVDINQDAIGVLAETYPELAAAGTFHTNTIESLVRTFEDGRFDAIYSVETLQHVHPDCEWVFAELARITDDLLVTVESEPESDDPEERVTYVDDDFPLYRRDWHRVFTDLGLAEVESAATKRDQLRAFRHENDE